MKDALSYLAIPFILLLAAVCWVFLLIAAPFISDVDVKAGYSGPQPK